ncbi:MAG: efflux transporter outer membrane subunit [Deltaproteobacteria bacterium]|nr:efflux transporter outer membrane subunit [Deltaproteobacteria bacterium]
MKNIPHKTWIIPTLFLAFLLFNSSYVFADETGPAAPMFDSSDAIDTPPWEHFNDPVLEQLIKEGLKDNPGVNAAKERINLARAGAKAALAPLLPSISAEGMYGLNSYDTKLTGISIPTIPGMTTSTNDINYTQTFTASLKAQYMVDITGRYYTQREAALKDAEAQIEDARSAAVVLATEIMQAYFDVVSARSRINLINDQIENNEKQLNLVIEQFKRGLATALDILQQKQQLYGKQAQLPQAEFLYNTSKRQLATLVGLDSMNDLPKIPDVIPEPGKAPENISLEQLENLRPDLRAARNRISANEKRTSSAKRALAPSLILNGQYGYKVSKVSDTNHGDTWSAGAVLTVPIFMGEANHAALDQARATSRSAELAYEDSRRKAITQVENSLETEETQKAYLQALEKQYDVSKQTVIESRKRYIGGELTYLNVLSAISALQINELSLIQARRDLLSARIKLLSAIGGTWTEKLIKE